MAIDGGALLSAHGCYATVKIAGLLYGLGFQENGESDRMLYSSLRGRGDELDNLNWKLPDDDLRA